MNQWLFYKTAAKSIWPRLEIPRPLLISAVKIEALRCQRDKDHSQTPPTTQKYQKNLHTKGYQFYCLPIFQDNKITIPSLYK